MASFKDRFKYFIEYPAGVTTEVFPTNDPPKFSISKERGKLFYRLKMVGDLFFLGDSYQFFKDIEDDDHCAEMLLSISVHGQMIDGFVIQMQNAVINKSYCSISVSPVINDAYTCLSSVLDYSANVLQLTTKNVVNVATGTIVTRRAPLVGYDTATGLVPLTSTLPHSTTDLPDLAGWVAIENHFQDFTPAIPGNSPPYSANHYTIWVREQVTSATQPPGDGWIFNGGSQWVRSPQILFDYDNSISPSILNPVWHIEYYLAQGSLISIDNGVLLGEAIESILAQSGCSLTVVSNFLNINGDGTAPANDEYTHAINKLQNLMMFQKSDVKRSEVSNNASIGVLTIKEVFEMLETGFQVFPVVVGSVLRLENITYFQKTLSIDLTGGVYRRWVKGLNSYEYDNTENPRFEYFEWMENNFCSTEFQGQPFDYGAACSNKDSENKVTRRAGRFITDIASIIKNPDSFSDDGFVLVNTHFFNGAFSFDFEVSKYPGFGLLLNGHLSFPNLQYHYFQHYRYQLEAQQYGFTVSFLSRRKNKKQTPISIPGFSVASFLAFNPSGYISTAVSSEGELESLEWDSKTGVAVFSVVH